MLKIVAVVFCLAALSTCQVPIDFAYYHDLHLPHSPPLHPTLARDTIHTVFSCQGRARGYYADLDTGCQVRYHLYLPHSPPLHPTLACDTIHTVFSCQGRARGYYADLDTGCQAYHFCWHQRLVATDLCANGTLFNEQFQVCDHFYNVRCGSPYEDL
ncbi:uncharacterized protein LOC134677103 [Cydia fagiglandana]|uniref:uncharacterized protein LOC134677103 n=1 Tax=Cydia fagiglandana TaxID=1458189 RepID=UPI002FEE5B7C